MSSVIARGVGKRYRHAPGRGGRGRPKRTGGRSFWALRDVSLEIGPARTVGIIGPNGAGKSTLLRLIAGVGAPDEGTIEVEGKVGSIFELGAGFHADLTGRESAVLTGVISGLSRREMAERLPEIVAFAELEPFIDDRIRMYSSGMIARLAFAIAVHIDADVLLVDEALAVGDVAFQERCIDRLRGFQRDGASMAIVSHSPAALRGFCDEVVWLRGGVVVATGKPDEVTERYAAAMRERARSITPVDARPLTTPEGRELVPGENRVGTLEAQLVSVRMVGEEVRSGGPLDIAFVVDAPPALGTVMLGVHVVRDEDGLLCLDVGTPLRPPADGSSTRNASLEIQRLDLSPGSYSCEVGVYTSDFTDPYDYHAGVYPLTVTGGSGGGGILSPPMRWRTDVGRRP